MLQQLNKLQTRKCKHRSISAQLSKRAKISRHGGVAVAVSTGVCLYNIYLIMKESYYIISQGTISYYISVWHVTVFGSISTYGMFIVVLGRFLWRLRRGPEFKSLQTAHKHSQCTTTLVTSCNKEPAENWVSDWLVS